MTYPQIPLPVTIEMWAGASSGWQDITSYVFVRDGGISIWSGFPDEGTTPEPSNMTMTLNNRDGRFTPRNPMSPYYGLIGRNTPVRVRVGGGIAGDPYLAIEGTAATDRATTPDAAALDITGDIDIRIDAAYDTWAGTVMAGKYEPTGDQRSWAFAVTSGGNLSFAWSATGTSSVVSRTSTVAAGLVDGQRKALRVTLDADNGSGFHVTTFYTADTIDGPWVQLGSPVNAADPAAIFASSAVLEVGRVSAFGAGPTGKVFAFELRSGIDGTLVADPDFTAEHVDQYGATIAWADSSGRTWTSNGDTRIHDPGIRGVLEVSEWPTRWDPSEQDVWTEITAQGILRRLGQGNRPIFSPIRSFLLGKNATFAAANGYEPLIAYWPMEDSGSSSGLASALPGGAPMRWAGTAPDLGENGIGPLLGSDRLPVLASDTSLIGLVTRGWSSPTGYNVQFHMDIPPSPAWTDGTPIIRWNCDPSADLSGMEVRWRTGGDLEVGFLDENGTFISGSVANTNLDNIAVHVFFVCSTSTDGATGGLRFIDGNGELSSFSLGIIGSGALAGTGLPTSIQIAPVGGLGDLAIGQVTAWGFQGTTASTNVVDGLLSFAGEVAATRAERLTGERGIRLTLAGNADDTAAMGAQAIPSTFIDAFNETHAADMALVSETRDELGLTFRTRRDLYNQTIALTLDYTASGEIAPDLEPTDDDRYVRNDIEVKRKNGSSYRAVDSTSRMGTQDPPDGVGPYEDQPEVNLYTDSQLKDQAHWRLHIGTWDEPRYPRVVVNMLALAAAGKFDLIAQIAALKVGDRIRLTNLPDFAGSPGGTVDLMVLGFQPETLVHPVEWEITLVCVPYGPYVVGAYAESSPAATDSRYDTAGCLVTAGLRLPGASGSYLTTPDAAALDITGDIDIRVDISPDEWVPAATMALVSKWAGAGNRSYLLNLTDAGLLQLAWSEDGSAVAGGSPVSSTVPVPETSGRLAVRATLDVDDGSSQHVVTFYTGSLLDGPWTQLGDAVTTAGTTSIHAGNLPVEVGSHTGGTTSPLAGIVHHAQIRDGIDGTVVANPQPYGQATGTTSFADSAGLTWTVNGSGAIYDLPVVGTSTSWLVHTYLGQSWSTSTEFPMQLKCSGAVVSVTAVSGPGRSQVLTVTAAPVNGVTKTLTQPAEISLADPARYAM